MKKYLASFIYDFWGKFQVKKIAYLFNWFPMDDGKISHRLLHFLFKLKFHFGFLTKRQNY